MAARARHRPLSSGRPTARRSRKAPPAALVLLVRHGTTPTTGKVLPGQAAGLHLAEKGRAQAEAAAQRIAALAKAPAAVYASPLERTRETAAPIARALGLRVRTAPGLIEADVGDWTEKRLSRLYRDQEWPTVQRWPSGVPLPRRGVVRRNVGPLHGRRARPGGRASRARPWWRSPTPIRSRRSWPRPPASRSTSCSASSISPCSISAMLFRRGRPAGAVRQLHRRRWTSWCLS